MKIASTSQCGKQCNNDHLPPNINHDSARRRKRVFDSSPQPVKSESKRARYELSALSALSTKKTTKATPKTEVRCSSSAAPMPATEPNGLQAEFSITGGGLTRRHTSSRARLVHNTPSFNDRTAAPQKSPEISTDELYSKGPLPPPGPERWKYLTDPGHWVPSRRKLHYKLINKATRGAMKFAEAMRAGGSEPAIYALRGNTAVGKTRMVTSQMPALRAALDKSSDGIVNPDQFKPPLRSNGKQSLNSAQVHAESCVLADRLEDELRSMTAADGTAASFVVDKRLAWVSENAHYAQMASSTGRKLVLCDVDAPLENSLVGVLERDTKGADPTPPYQIVSDGFSAVRTDRVAVIDQFINNPKLGTYQLYGTDSTGSKVKVASVEHGALVIERPDIYAELIAPPSTPPETTGNKKIDMLLINRLTEKLAPDRARAIRQLLSSYNGLTWKQALDHHSARSE